MGSAAKGRDTPEVHLLTGQRVVLVSGGAAGIGRAIARGFLAAGDLVHVFDQSEPAIETLKREHPSIESWVADASNVSDVDRVFDQLSATRGRLDVLVNNVGVSGPTATVDKIDPADWDRTIAVDLSASFYCTRRAVPLLKAAGGGSIVNIASNAALFGFPLRSPYTAAKWALIGLTKTWAMELGVHGIRVNALCPGSVNGPRIDGVIERDAQERGKAAAEIRDVYLRQSSMRVFVEADDVARTAQFLASEAGRYISGQAIAIDGHTEGLSNWLD